MQRSPSQAEDDIVRNSRIPKAYHPVLRVFFFYRDCKVCHPPT
ncbi:MAG: hypothetical protein SOW03_03740 [Campylobacter sp.]|nr:hypothetical protein [Campylobacteraceae bacterium]MDY2635435.1 hypothetical protein [Campylobacter sp.]